MKIKSKIIILLVLLLCININPVYANEFIDARDHLSLSIKSVHENDVISGMTFKLYHVGNMSDNLELSWSDSFKQFEGIIELNDLDELAWKEVADTLESYVLFNDIEPIQVKKTNELGELEFDQPFTQGLYLILGHKYYRNGRTYAISPSLISLPQLLDSSWNGEVVINSKYEDIGEDTRIKVIKQWDDSYNSKNRPSSITVALLQDGDVYDYYELNKNNDWRIVIEDLEAGYDYKVVEVEVKNGYKVSIQEDNRTFIVKNTLINQPPRLDQTGVLWWPVPILAIFGLSCILIGLNINKRSELNEG